MELFDHFSKNVNYRDCKSLEDASEVALTAIEASGMRPQDVLRRVLGELGGMPVHCLPEQFRSLRDAAFFTVSVNDALEYEFMAYHYPSNVADILVGLLLLHGQLELREHLKELRSTSIADGPIGFDLPREGECCAETGTAAQSADVAQSSV